MNFPTRQHWFDSLWPEVSYIEDKNILVPIYRHTKLEELEANVIDNPNHNFLFIVEDFDHFNDNMPISWRRMDSLGGGGIPPNVWIGAGVSNQKEADERMRRLVKLRARVLFILLKKNHNQKIDLKHGLIAWRCSNCGVRGGYNRLTRPKECPTGSICEGSMLKPQIHWVVSMETYENGARAKRCDRLGVAFWDGKSLEVPE